MAPAKNTDDLAQCPEKATQLGEKSDERDMRSERLRAVSIAEGAMDFACDSSKAQDIAFMCHGIQGRYSGEVNEEGKPHGNGSFVRNQGGMTYIGEWKDGERIGNGGFYTNGRLLGNVVWE